MTVKTKDNKPVDKKIVAEHGLTQEEYKRIQKILGRHPNLTELGIFSVLWSEHCSYKHSKPLLKLFPTKGKYVLQGPGENAGIVDIGDGVALSFKMESHNHPSAVEPFQGAATGVGGIIRDVFTMGARPIAGLDSLRFGRIDNGNVRNKFLFNGVVAGIAHYGNCFGLPTVAGEVYFDETYRTNILVNAMCIGVVQSGDKEIDPLYGPIVKGLAAGVGNRVLYVGNDTGRDGIHGATFASVEISDETAEKRSSVQVGDPFKEKLLVEACLELIKTGIVVGMQDMGAAGLTSSTSEMASRAGSGLELYLDKVPQREKNMTAYEIMLSESQERMVVIVQRGKEEVAYKIFEKWGLHAVDIGQVTDDGMYRIFQHGEVVAEIPVQDLVADAPVYEIAAEKPYYLEEVQKVKIDSLADLNGQEIEKAFLKLLGEPNIASKKYVFEQYDHMVQTNTVVVPGISDAAVLRIKGTNKKIACTSDCNSLYCYLDPFTGGAISIAEAARNLACVGARPVGVTDCLNFANPEKPENFWIMRKVCEGMALACREFEAPIISGNVSMYNESEEGPIFPTPTIGMVGIINPEAPRMTMEFKDPGDLIVLLGETRNALGGTEFLKSYHDMQVGLPPQLNLQKEKNLHNLLIESIEKNLLKSAHDLSEGGLVIGLAESAACGNKGIEVELKTAGLRKDALLFAETQSRAIISLTESNWEKLQKLAQEKSVSCQIIGKVKTNNFEIKIDGQAIINTAVEKIKDIYFNSIERYLKA